MTGVDSSYEFVTMSETSTANDPAQAASWDLTSQISPHLDLHMMFPLLEYVDSLITAGLVPYTHGDVAASRLALLRPTHMVDYAMDIYRELPRHVLVGLAIQELAGKLKSIDRIQITPDGIAPLLTDLAEAGAKLLETRATVAAGEEA